MDLHNSMTACIIGGFCIYLFLYPEHGIFSLLPKLEHPEGIVGDLIRLYMSDQRNELIGFNHFRLSTCKRSFSKSVG